MGSIIQRKRQGRYTVTRNLTTGTVTTTVSDGFKRGSGNRTSQSTRVDSNGDVTYKTTFTRKHGEGLWSRTTKSRKYSATNKGASWGIPLMGMLLFGSSKSKSSSKNKVPVQTVEASIPPTEPKQEKPPGLFAKIVAGWIILMIIAQIVSLF